MLKVTKALVRMVVIGTIAALEDKNREDDTVTLNLYTGGVGSASVVTDLSIVATDIHKLAPPAAITAVAKDAALNGDDVTEIVEGGDACLPDDYRGSRHCGDKRPDDGRRAHG